MAADGSRGASERDAPRGRPLDLEEQDQLLTAVKALPCMIDPSARQMVVAKMQRQLGQGFSPARSTSTDSDVFSIVEACLANEAVTLLVAVTKMVGGMTDSWSDLNQLVEGLYQHGVVLITEFAKLQEHLRALNRQQLAAILGSPLLAQQVDLQTLDPQSPMEAFRRFELASSEPEGGFRLLAYLELAAHQLPQERSKPVHAVIDEIAERQGLTTRINQICRQLFLAGDAGEIHPPDSVPNIVDTVSHGSTTPDPGDEESMKSTSTHAREVEPGIGPVAPAVWGGVPPRNRNFTGRQDLLGEIKRLLRHRTQASLLPQAVYGLGGVGKTQLAVEYVYLNQGDYDLVWWIPSDEQSAVTRSLVSLAKRLGLEESQDQERTVEAVIDELRVGRPTPHWLLVFDNAPDPLTVRDFLPPGPGHILITSRSQEWKTAGPAVSVDVFTADEATEFLTQRWTGITREETLSLADRLGHLPLALEHAAALHEQTGMPLDEYLRNFDTAPVKVLEEVPSDYQRSVAVTFRLGYDQLRQRSPEAAQLLELCAFLSEHPIAIQMLIRGRNAVLPEPLGTTLRDDILLRRAVRNIGQFALAQLDPGRGLIRVHRLVRAVLLADAQHDAQAAMRQAAFAVLAAANPGEPDDPATWTQHRQIAPHIASSGIIESDDRGARQTVLDQIRYLYVVGDYATSQNLAQTVVERWRARLGDGDVTTLVATRHWADSLRALGDREDAFRINGEALDRMREILGDEHDHTLATARGFGADLRLQGEFQRARQLDSENFERCKRILGEDDPSTLRSQNSLALDERLLGNLDVSLRLQRDARDRCLNVLGEEHPQTLVATANLSRDLYGLGHYRDGLDLLRDKLDLLESRLGPSHVSTLLARRYLAILLRKSGEYKDALEAAEQNYSHCLLYRRRTHDLTLAAMVTVSNCLRVVGEVEQAESLGAAALEAYKETFGDRHPFTLACANNYAIALRAVGRHEQANTLDEATYAALTEILGPRHPHVLCSATGRAANRASAGMTEEALALSKELYESSQRVRRQDHPTTLACAANLALDLEAAGDKPAAVVLRDDTIRRMRQQLGEGHPETSAVVSLKRAECDIEIPTT